MILCSLNRFLRYTKCFVTILRSTKYGAGARGVTLMPALQPDFNGHMSFSRPLAGIPKNLDTANHLAG